MENFTGNTCSKFYLFTWILKISYDKNCGYYYVTSSHATGNAARDDRARFWNEKEEKKEKREKVFITREKNYYARTGSFLSIDEKKFSIDDDDAGATDRYVKYGNEFRRIRSTNSHQLF